MNRSTYAIVMVVVITFLYFGCGYNGGIRLPVNPGSGGTTANLSIEVDYAQKKAVPDNGVYAKTAAVEETESIDQVTVYVYDAPWTEHPTPILTQDLDITDNTFASGSIEIPLVGDTSSRDIDIHILFYGVIDSQTTVVRYFGEKNASVILGEDNLVSITVVYMGVDTRINSGTDIVESWNCYTYIPITLTWDEVVWGLTDIASAYGWSYTLQESDHNDNFNSPASIYSGNNAQYTITTGKSSVGNYFYRARVDTMYGPGPWHSTGTASVTVKKRKGNININIPLPEDEPQ